MNLFRIGQVISVMAVTALLAFACNKDEEEVVLDFNITVPDDWEYYLLDDPYYVYWAISPLSSENDSVQEDLMISREKMNGMSLESYYSKIIDLLEDQDGFQLLYSTDTTINGADCKMFLHLQTMKAVDQYNDTSLLDVKDRKYVFVRDNYGYVVNCASLIPTYDFYKPVFDGIMSTFTFKVQ